MTEQLQSGQYALTVIDIDRPPSLGGVPDIRYAQNFIPDSLNTRIKKVSLASIRYAELENGMLLWLSLARVHWALAQYHGADAAFRETHELFLLRFYTPGQQNAHTVDQLERGLVRPSLVFLDSLVLTAAGIKMELGLYGHRDLRNLWT